MKRNIFITKDGLISVDVLYDNERRPHIKRVCNPSYKPFYEGEISEEEVPKVDCREYDYIGRVKDFYLYEEK